MNNGGVEYRWFRFSDGTYDWIRNTGATDVDADQVRYSVTWEDLRNGAEIIAPSVTADDGYTFSGDWADADGVLFSSLEASLGAMDDDGVTEITYYAAYTTDETGGETGGGTTGRDDDDDDDRDDDSGRNDPAVEIPEEEVPRTDVPAAGEEPAADIPEQDVPMAEAAETGDASALLALMTAASGSGLTWLAVSGRKRKDQDAE